MRCEHSPREPRHLFARCEPVALGEEAVAGSGNDRHLVLIESAKSGPYDPGGIGGPPVDATARGALVTQAG
jgi:hypothetical protein